MQKSNLIRLFEDLLITSTSAEQITLLERIHLELSSISSLNEFEQIHHDVPWSHLFDLIRSNKNDEVERLLCSILEHFINNLTIEQMMNKFYPLLETGLEQDVGLSQRSKLLCLKAFEKLSRCSTKECFFIIQNLMQHRQINAVLHLFLDSDQQVLWLKSKEILEQMIRTVSRIDDEELLKTYLRDQYFHPSNREILLSADRRNEIVRLRLYEYLIDLCLVNAHIYRHITEEQHLLNQFLQDCTHRDEDILYLMNLLELMTSLTQKPHTLVYLQNKTDVIGHYYHLLASADDNPMIDLVKPGLIKFFGSYLRNYLVLLETTPIDTDPNHLLERFLPFLFDIFLQTESNTYTVLALDTVGFIGKTGQGKEYMLSNGKFADFIDRLVRIIRSSQSEIRTRSLTCLADLFHISPQDRTSSSTVITSTERIFTLCNRTFALLPIIIGIAKQPFSDLRLAAYRCLLELTRSPWALQALNNEPGFLEFILNRSTEKDKEGKEVKFAIIRSMCENADQAKSIFGNVNYLKLRRYLNEGVFYVEPEANVAFEGSNE